MSIGISVRDLRYGVPGREILKGVDLEIAPGEILTVMGVSGGGKTTPLKCMAGLVRPTGGEIHIGDLELTRLSESELNEQRRCMGMVFQYAALFDSLTVYENVVFALKHRGGYKEPDLRKLAKERLAAVGLEETENMMPSQLSGGMRKRVGLARAL